MDFSENPFWQSFAFHFSCLEGYQPNPQDKHHLQLFRYFRVGAESELPKDAPQQDPTVFGMGEQEASAFFHHLRPHCAGTIYEPRLWRLFSQIKAILDRKRKGGPRWYPANEERELEPAQQNT